MLLSLSVSSTRVKIHRVLGHRTGYSAPGGRVHCKWQGKGLRNKNLFCQPKGLWNCNPRSSLTINNILLAALNKSQKLVSDSFVVGFLSLLTYIHLNYMVPSNFYKTLNQKLPPRHIQALEMDKQNTHTKEPRVSLLSVSKTGQNLVQ